MTAQTKYVTSLLSVFSTFLESLSVSKDLALLTTEKFIVFITNCKKNDENWTQHWSTAELEKFISDQNVPHKSAFLMKKFVSDYTPFEVDIFLHEFLVSLKLEHRSDSTIKNYKSDIQQFAALAGNKDIKHFFDPANLRAFAHEQIKSEHKISTIKRKLASISQFALWAEKQKIVTDASFWISDLDSLISKNNNAVFSRYNNTAHHVNQHQNNEGHNTQPTPEHKLSNSKSDITSALENYLLSLTIEGHSEATIRNYKSDISQFIEFALNIKTEVDLDNNQLNKIITQEKITDFVVSQRKSGLKASSVKRKITSLTQFFLWCESRNLVIGVSNWVHSLSDIFFVSSSTELKIKPSPLIHAHEKRVVYPDNFTTVNHQGENNHNPHTVITKKQGWSLPIPSFAISEVAHIGTDAKNGNENNPKNNQFLATTHSVTQENQNIFSGIRNNLNEFATQINTKRNKQFLPYLNLLMMILFAIGLGVLGYQQFITLTPTPFAYPSSPVRPNRELSFQGRLTDTAQNPITTATNMTFRLYDTGPGTGGTLLWNSGSCSVTPDQDGIFNVGLGDDCGAEIAQDVFTENSNVWLEVQIAAETLTPRQSIKTVAYALNSETVQGYPISASGAATTNTILVMDAGGQVLLGEVSPKIKSTSGTFAIEAQALTLETSSGSNGNIIINPDGTGKVIVQSNLDLEGYLHAPGATFSATYAGGTALVAKGGPSSTANIQEWQNSAGTALALVDENGNVGIGTANPTATLQLTSATGTDLIKFQRTNATASNWSLGYNDDNAILIFKPASDQYWRVENAASSNVFEVNTITGGVVVGSSYGLTNPPANGAIIQGNVGIGTSNPSSKLHVGSGDIKLDAGYDVISETNSIEVYNGGNGALSLTAATNGPASRGINLIIGSTTQLRVDKLGNVGIGTTDPANFKLQITGNIGPTTDSTYNLGSATYAWANIYGDAIYQNGNLVCDASGANCPASFGVNYWRLASGALSPVNDTTDLLIGSNASASAKFAFLNVNSGTPTASVSGNSGNIATYLTGDGTLATTNRQSLTIGNSSTYNTTGNVLINPNGTGNVGIGTTNTAMKLEVVGGINLSRSSSTTSGIQWYNNTYNAWSTYMAQVGQSSVGPRGTLTAPNSTLVTSWGLRSFIESVAGYGWTFESGWSGETTPTVVAEIRSSDGSARFGGSLTVQGAGASSFVGNVGIGTTAPLSKLAINGDLAANTATISATYAAGIPLTVKGGPSGTGDIQQWQNSSGNVLARVESTGRIVLANNTSYAMYNAAGSGVVPLFRLDTSDNLNIGSAATVADTFLSGSSSFRTSIGGNEQFRATSTSFTVNESGLSTIDFRVEGDTNANLIFADASADFVGIGTGTPGYTLDVTGELNLTDAIRSGGSAGTSGYLLTSSGGGAMTWTDPASLVSGSTWWTNTLNVLHPKNEYANIVDLTLGGTSTSSADIHLYADGSATFNEQGNDADFRVEASGQTNALFVQGSDGNVGIGTNNPGSKLTVSGNVSVSGAVAPGADDTYDLGSSTRRWQDLFLGPNSLHIGTNGNEAIVSYNTTSNYLGFDPDGDATNEFVILDGGNVGINTTTASSFMLEVAGSIGPSADNTYSLGSAARRFTNIYSSGSLIATGLTDADGDTKIQVEESADEDKIRLDTAGTERIIIDNTGKIGIGTSTPIHKLELSSAVTGKALVMLKELGDQDILTASNSSGVTRFVLANTGYVHAERFSDVSNSSYFLDPAGAGTSLTVVSNVGIGTTNPAAKLEVHNSSTEDILNLYDGASEVLTVIDGGYLGIGTTTPGYIADIVGRSRVRGANNSGGGFWFSTSAAPTTDITYFGRAADSEAWSGIYSNGDWRLYIPDASGNIGIGTSNPVQSLDTGGDLRVGGNDITDSGNAARITLGATTTLTNTTTTLSGTTNLSATSLTGFATSASVNWSNLTALTFSADNATIYGSDVADGDITIHGTSNATRTSSYVLLQPTAGNVGIGTTAPSQVLDINGDLRVRGNDITDSGNTTRITLGASTYVTSTTFNLTGTTNFNATSLTAMDTAATLNWTGLTTLTFGADNATINGSDAADGDLTLQGTSNATKTTSYVNIQPSGGFVGIGTTAPTAPLDVSGALKLDHEDAIASPSEATHNAFIVANTASNRTLRLGVIDNAYIRGEIEIENNNGSTGTIYLKTAPVGTANAVERLTVIPDGNVGIGTTVPTQTLDVNGTARIRTVGTGTFSTNLNRTSDGTLTTSTSDIRYKKDIKPLEQTLSKILELKPSSFKWINDEQQRTDFGFIAQDMMSVFPETVFEIDNSGYYGINYDRFAAILAKGIQELDNKVSSIFTNLVANTANITNLTVSSLQIGSQSIENYIIEVINSQNTDHSNELASPIVEELTVDSLVADTVNTRNLTATGSSTLSTLLTENLSVTNNATIGGELTTSSLLTALVESEALTTQDATVTGTLEAGTLIVNQVDATSSRIAALEAGIAQLETVRANTAELVTATVSGTLYADNIYDFENKVATTLQQPGLLDILLGTDESTASASFMQDLYNTVNTTSFNASESADLDLSLTELSMTSDDVALTGTALFIEKYFKVNGAGYISDSLAVGNKLFVGETMQIADGLIKYTTTDPANQILKIQPDGQGKIELLAGIVTIDDTGVVTVTGEINITGNAKVGGTLLTNMLKPTDFGNPFQVQVAGVDTQSGEVKKSRFEIINEVGTPVATFSAEGSAQFAGKAEFAGGIGIASQDLGSNDINELTANKTSGRATIKAGATEVIIKSSIITNDTLVYVTAVGSTANQVLYVKSQTAEDTNTPDQDGKFVVGFDNQTNSDVTFNWWIVN